MDDLQVPRLVEAALRCYPRHWQRRHGDEAAELAALLILDGTPALSVACSYLTGAALEWLTPRRAGRRLSTAAFALLAAAFSLGISAALLASTVPAKAVGTNTSTTQHRPAHCRPVTQRSAASASPASPGSPATGGRPQATTQEPTDARSC